MTLAVAFAVYTIAVICVGLFTGRRTTSESEDYFLGGRTLGPWLTALSSGASGSSAWVTMGLVGYAFTSGLTAFWLIPGVTLGIAFNWLVMARRLHDRAAELGAITVPDLLSMHYGEKWPVIRLMTIGVILTAMFFYVAAQMAAAGQLFAYAFPSMPSILPVMDDESRDVLAFLRTPYATGVVLGVVIVLAYTIVGGFRAACWTDLVQSSMMLIALVVVPIVMLVQLGGDAPLTDMLQMRPELRTVLPPPDAGAVATLGFIFGSGALGINLGYPGQPHILVRLIAMRDRKVVLPGIAIQLTWTLLIYTGAIMTGLLVRNAALAGVDWGGGDGPG